MLAAWSKRVVFCFTPPHSSSLCGFLALSRLPPRPQPSFMYYLPPALVFTLCPHHCPSFYLPILSSSHSLLFSFCLSCLHTQYQTNFVCLTCALLPCVHSAVCGSLTLKHPSSVIQPVPLSYIPLLPLKSSEPRQGPCHSTRLLSLHTPEKKTRNVFRARWSTVISPPVWNDSLLTDSFIGNSLNKQTIHLNGAFYI